MEAGRWPFVALIVTVTVTLLGCGLSPIPTQPLPSICPVTVGTPGTKPPPPVSADDLPVGYVDTWFGNSAIWTRLPISGVIPGQPTNGAGLRAKLPWWRLASGQIEVSSSRLGSSAGFSATVGTVSAYGPDGFVPSDLTFDGPGCWEIRGSLGDQALSFVAEVIAQTP
jgi:hypothetical protein